MSGNPFRRTQPDRQMTPSPPNKSKGKKKRVTIQTPPHSPEDTRDRPIYGTQDGRPGTPPPAQSYFNADDLESASSSSDSESTPHVPPPLSTLDMRPPLPTSLGNSSTSKAPYNPFERTLATKEASFGRSSVDMERRLNGEIPNAKPAFDVDTFKNILMGNTPTPGAMIPAPTLAESNQASIDLKPSASVAFDTVHQAHPESPRISLDRDDLYLNESDDSQDEDRSLMGPVETRPQEIAPQAPPKNTSSRTIPQTVSFADFEDSFFGVTSPQSKDPAVIPSSDSIRQRLSSRSISDVNKPLPVPPPEPERTQPSAGLLSPRGLPSTSDNGQTKKAPPPPPTARRQAPSSGTAGRPRSISGNPVQESTDGEALVKTTSRPPVPPPPRAFGTPQPASPRETPAQLSRTTSSATLEPKATPPPPPRRNPSKSGTPLARTPSTASRSSVNEPQPNLNVPVAPSVAPTPPPPRRAPGAAKRNGADGQPLISSDRRAIMANVTNQRRASAHSLGSDRSGSIVSLQRVDEPDEYIDQVSSGAGKPPARDILADMTAFQAEIDALRVAQGG